jgi:hypothetical protein
LGQEITTTKFSSEDFEHFRHALLDETRLLVSWFEEGALSTRHPVAGFEIEAWLLNDHYLPNPVNDGFLSLFADELATPELARFNIELNTHPLPLAGKVLSLKHAELKNTLARAQDCAKKLDSTILMTGILPTLRPEHLTLANMSDMRRYRALNEQVLNSRDGRPLKLEITGAEPLSEEHDNVMLESATTSFQVHLQAPFDLAHHYYNASIIASAPLVAACANAPYLFGHELWEETRIPLFEQSVEIGGYAGVAGGPLRRVSFGSGYARNSILECFAENLEHFPVLLPIEFDNSQDELAHLRLHNGTIWRWNRPLIGFDPDGIPHIRIEHRPIPAGPSLGDSIANAALYYGLAVQFMEQRLAEQIEFPIARDNFYKAAKSGLNATIIWPGTGHISIRQLLLEQLIPEAREGLSRLGLDPSDIDHYMNIMHGRIETGQNGSEWQRRFCTVHDRHYDELTAAILHWQSKDLPVHEWDL